MASKNLLITGASSGIGRATVEYFASRGWKVAATMRNPSRAGDLNNLTGVAIYKLDVTQPHNVMETIHKVWDDMGGIDVIVNNAGYGALGILEGASDDQIIRQMDTNLLGTLRVIRNVLPLMRQRGKGTIINLSSIAGKMGLPLYTLYHASKYAVEGMTESLYYELRPFNIKVRLIEPGPVKTEFNGRSRDELLPPDDQRYIAISQKVSHFYNAVFKHAAQSKTVARTIFKAATAKNWRLRYPSGSQARLFLTLYAILPGQIFRKLTRWMINI